MTPGRWICGAALAAALASCTAFRSASDSGVRGRITVGPMCPVVQAGFPCPDAPLEAEVEILNGRGRVVARGRSDAEGVYRIPLPAGEYLLVPLSPGEGGLPMAASVTLTVEPGAWTTLDLVYDSGIR